MAKFPTSVPSFPTHASLQPIFPQHMNAVQEEVTAIAATVIATPANLRRAPLVVQGANPQVVLDDTGANLAKARFIMQTGGAPLISANASWNGAWGVDDIGQRSSMLILDHINGRLNYYTAAGGAAVPAWSLAYSIDVTTGLQYERGRAAAMGTWVTYTPVWQSTGTPQPVLGNGAIKGTYTVIGKTVYVRFTLGLGSTTTQGGAGWWYFSVPPGYPLPASGMDNVGSARLVQGVNYIGGAFPANTGNFAFIAEGSANVIVGPGTPWAWAAGGSIYGWLTYETP